MRLILKKFLNFKFLFAYYRTKRRKPGHHSGLFVDKPQRANNQTAYLAKKLT